MSIKERESSEEQQSSQTTYEVEEEEVCSLYPLTSKHAIKLKTDAAGRELEMIVDTGATVIAIPKEMYEKHLSHVKVNKSTGQGTVVL